MMKAKWAAAAALLSMSAGALADGTYQYESVTKIELNGAFHGVLVGDTVPTTLAVPNSLAKCASWIELVFANPGKYLLTVTVTTTVPPPYPATTAVSSCFIEKAP